MVTVSLALGGRLSKALRCLVFDKLPFTCCKKGRCLRLEQCPAHSPEFFIDGCTLLSLSLSLFGFLFLNLPLWLELTFSLYLLSKCFETTEGGGFAKITPIKDCSCGWWRSQQHAKRTGCYLQCHEMFKMLLD